MAKFHYDLVLGEEIIYRDVPVYDASTLVNGQFVMLDPAAATDCRFINGYTGDSGEMVDGLGTICETLNTSSVISDTGDAITTPATTTQKAISSVAATMAQGHRYGKCIINPFAVYLTEYDQTGIALTSAWNSTTLTLTSIEANIGGGWVFSVSASTTPNFAGQLRYLTAAGSGNVTVDSAPTVNGAATNDKIIKILPIAARLTALTSDGQKLASQAAAGAGVSLCIVENYLGGPYQALEPLRAQRHKGLKTNPNAKLYADVMMLNSLYNPLS